MNYRINTTSVILVLLLVLVVVGMFVYTLIIAPTEPAPEVTEDVPPAEEVEGLIINAKHQYKDGVHTIVGKAEVPTRCHRLVTEPFFVSDDKSAVEVRFSTLLEGESCPAEVYEVPFRVTFEAVEDVSISATWNGDTVRFNLIPVGPDEVLDDEIYIKG